MSTQSLYSFLKDKGFSPQQTKESTASGGESPAERRAARPPSSKHASEEDRSGPRPLVTFDSPNITKTFRQASEEQLHAADFGIVRVDNEGIVSFYNQYESDLAGIEPEEAHGKNFFTELAPCSNNRIFYGRFKEGIRSGNLDKSFTYTFTYKMRPTLVDVRMCGDASGRNWILIRKRGV
ncbi:PAS domain-containing protein [Salisaeta longa]|uniref:PAS domain-containing protein n=1 Tax=Salisaeta longa TaxID=503170 RepID=UPI0003B4287F|nr:PAS domain-containing protein [Salisaeta longa]